MDRPSSLVDSDDESNPDALVLETDHDFSAVNNCPATSTSRDIASVWRDLVVDEQMEGGLLRLGLNKKKENYTDIDDPNYIPTKNGKRSFSSTKSKHKNKSADGESEPFAKKRCLHDYDFTYHNKNLNNKNFAKKKEKSASKNNCRVLPEMCNSEEMTSDQFLKELCKNLHERNTTIMSNVVSKIDRKTILEKYNKTCLIEANGGEMTKNGDRRRTSGGIFCNLIKEDKLIPNSAKKGLFGNSRSDETLKLRKREKEKRRKERLKKEKNVQNRKEDDVLKQSCQKSELDPINCVREDGEVSDSTI